jgi:hypothetical protein
MEEHYVDSSSSDAERSRMTQALVRLEYLTQRLRMYGQILAVLTTVTVAGSIALAFYRVFNVILVVFETTLGVIAVSAFQALILAALFESRRKEGDVLFKELSDEFQWYIRFGRDKKAANDAAPDHRPGLEARLALRSFAQGSDLPLAPGAYGPLLYALINILSVAFVAVSLLPFFRKY